MKKLFFTAFVAVVAVGGSFSTQAIVYQDPNGNVYDCQQEGYLCITIIRKLRIYGSNDNYPIYPGAEFTIEEHNTVGR